MKRGVLAVLLVLVLALAGATVTQAAGVSAWYLWETHDVHARVDLEGLVAEWTFEKDGPGAGYGALAFPLNDEGLKLTTALAMDDGFDTKNMTFKLGVLLDGENVLANVAWDLGKRIDFYGAIVLRPTSFLTIEVGYKGVTTASVNYVEDLQASPFAGVRLTF